MRKEIEGLDRIEDIEESIGKTNRRIDELEEIALNYDDWGYVVMVIGGLSGNRNRE